MGSQSAECGKWGNTHHELVNPPDAFVPLHLLDVPPHLKREALPGVFPETLRLRVVRRAHLHRPHQLSCLLRVELVVHHELAKNSALFRGQVLDVRKVLRVPLGVEIVELFFREPRVGDQ